MKMGGSCASIALTCMGEVWVRSTTSSGPGGRAGPSATAPATAGAGSIRSSGSRLAGST